MAETLTFENQSEVTTAENLNADEQDSLKVGEEMQEAQDNLLAGKYKDAQELENAYIELQKKLGDNEPQTDDTSKVEEVKSEKEVEPKAKETEGTTILESVWEQSIEDSFQDETVEQLRKTDPIDLANQYLEYRRANGPQELSEAQAKGLKDVVGGEESYKNMISWANQALDPKEIDMFDQVMDKGDPLACYFAVRSLAYRYEDTTGKQGEMVTGTAPKTSGSQFRSQAEVVKAMSDPRYERDSAYRQDVKEKLGRSDINF
tara:strand:+ start:23 stop:805 length:783 start_codon:yes stop_codon:yes gene_type:complete